MKKYEYKSEARSFIQTSEIEHKHMAVMGHEGWELVCVIKQYASDSTYVYYWKREKQ